MPRRWRYQPVSSALRRALEKRVPPGAWYEIIGALRHRMEDLPPLKKLAVAVADVVRLRPLQIDVSGETYIIKRGADEVCRGTLAECHRWLDLQQEQALLDAGLEQYLARKQ